MSYRESAAPGVDKTEVEKERIRQIEETKRAELKQAGETRRKLIEEVGIGRTVVGGFIALAIIVASAVVALKLLDVRSACHESSSYGATCDHPLHVRVDGVTCKCGIPVLPVAPTVRLP